MAQPQQSAVRNRLLAALTPEDFSRLASQLEPVPLPLHEVLIAPQQPIAQAYFVEEGIVSLVADTREGRIEVGLTGREGFVGVPIALGAQTTPHTAIVQASGEALRRPARWRTPSTRAPACAGCSAATCRACSCRWGRPSTPMPT
jgi:CRP-like cAMP-binding protein